MLLQGGCHCGQIRYEVKVENKFPIELVECNCSICTMKGIIHLIVPKSKMRLLILNEQFEEHITTYTFNTKQAKHYFCKHCGICPFYIPRSNPDGYDVNARTLDQYTTFAANSKFIIHPFDGQHWENNAESLKHLSKE